MLSTSALCRFIHKDVKKNTHALSDHYPNYIRPKVKTSNKQEYCSTDDVSCYHNTFSINIKTSPKLQDFCFGETPVAFVFCGKHLR